MRKYFIFLLIAIGGLIGCETDFDLNSDWKEIAVVYGLLDQSEDVQFVRLNKAFLTSGNALEAAQEQDSIYFNNPKVRLNEWSRNAVWNETTRKFEKDPDASLINTYELEKVDANSDPNLPNKEDGVFVDDPYFVYVFDQAQYPDTILNQNSTYELEIETDSGNKVSGITPLVRDFDILAPKSTQGFNLLADKRVLRWKEAGNGSIYDLDVVFNYREEVNNDPTDFTIKQVVYRPFSNFTGNNNGSSFDFDFIPESFLNYLKSEIGEEGSENYKRIFIQPLEFTFYAGSRQLEVFADVANISDNSINSGQARPFYTNVENGLGVIASRYKKTVGAPLSPASLTELYCGEITKGLRFVENSSFAVVCD